MRLRALHIRRLPGIEPGFSVEGLDPGINVVVGPNASGKSSVLRAVRALLYPEELAHAPVDVDGVFEDDAGELRVTRNGGLVAWSRDGEPVPAPELPPHHLLGCYTLGVEDLAALSGTDAEIARRLRLELLGGFDLAAVRDGPDFRPPGAGRSEAESLRRAEDRLRELTRQRETLREQQGRIAGWRRELEAAKRAAEEVTAHQRALDLLEARREVRALEERRAAFPRGMEALAGNEGERLESLRSRRESEARELREARAEARRNEQRLRETGLEGSDLTEATLAERRTLLHELHRLEGDADALLADLTRARARLRDAEAELRAAPPEPGAAAAAAPSPPSGDAPARLDPATLHRVDDALSRHRELEAERRALARERDELPRPDDDAQGAEAGVEALRDGRAALTSALAATRSAGWTPLRAIGGALLAGGAGSAVALAARAGTSWPWLAAAGAAALLGALLFSRDGNAAAKRAARARYRQAGLRELPAWRADAIAARLADLDEALARATERRAALLRRETLERRLTTLDEALESTAAGLRRVAEQVGFDPRHLDAGFQRWLNRVAAADLARAELTELAAELERKQDAVAARRDALTAFLQAHGESPDTPRPGAALLQQRLEALARRLGEREAASSDLRSAAAAIERAEAERARLQEEIRALFSDAGLEAAAEGDAASAEHASEVRLRERLERLPAYRALREELRTAEARRDERARELAGHEALLALVEADDGAGLRRDLEQRKEVAERRDELARDIASTEALIAQAERERALEAARAARDEAADALEDLTLATLRAEAGRFLLDRVASEHEERRQPPALRRAGEWFRRFTRHRFELAYDSRREPPFAAVETASGERRLPAELSTGTRAQLLVAMRVAFALEAEGSGASLPLFLDEALTTADAERFAEVADSLGLLAREDGRQLFYLTARGEDAALWQARSDAVGAGGAPHIIDIARIRRVGEAVQTPAALAAPPPPAVPDPRGVPPERYATLVGVPPLDPWRAADACHLFHLLRDALPLLRRLLAADIERVGALRSLLRGRAAGALLSGDERTLLHRRVHALDAFLEGWRRGRGRPVDRAALEASGAVSDTFLDRVEALSRKVDGDAAALLSGLASGEVSRFRSRDREALEAWLAQHDFLDERPPLPAAELRLKLADALAGDAPDRGPAGDPDLLAEAERLASWLLAAVRASRAPTPSDASAPDAPDPGRPADAGDPS